MFQDLLAPFKEYIIIIMNIKVVSNHDSKTLD